MSSDPELHATRLALRRAEAASYPTPLDALRAAVESLSKAFDLYASGPMLAILSDAEPDEYSDPDDIAAWQARQTMVLKLTLAMDRAKIALDRAFSPEEIGARDESERAALREAYQTGFRIGFADGRICERYECLARHVWIPRAPTADGMWDRCSSERTTKCVR